MYKLMFYLTTVNKILRHCHSWLARQYIEDLAHVLNCYKCASLVSYGTFMLNNIRRKSTQKNMIEGYYNSIQFQSSIKLYFISRRRRPSVGVSVRACVHPPVRPSVRTYWSELMHSWYKLPWTDDIL